MEINNLHRQVIHTENRVGISKVESAKQSLLALNSSLNITIFNVPFTSENAREIVRPFDVLIDCSDNPATRYLLNDVAFLEGRKPLVSGSALKMEGQLTVYHFDPEDPCYRCLFPKPPTVVTNCGDGGVLGCLTGVIGSYQAMEAVKIIISRSGASCPTILSRKMMIVDGFGAGVRMIKLRGRQEKCELCGNHPTITDLINYEEFVGSKACDKTPSVSLLPPQSRITCQVKIELIIGIYGNP